MSYAITISDEVYLRLQKLAAQQEQTPEAVVERLITGAEAASSGRRYYGTDEWLRHLGITDEQIAEIDAEIDAEEAADADA
jgi:predicted transcriptional regulator